MTSEDYTQTPEGSAEERPFRVGLFCALPYFGNMGCNALTVSLITILVRYRPKAAFHFLHRLRAPESRTMEIEGRTIPMNLVNCRLTPRAALRENLFWIYFMAFVHRVVPIEAIRSRIRKSIPWIAVLSDADIVASHFYGDSFSDIYGLRRFFWYAFYCGTAIAMGRRFVLLPQTYGPFQSRVARWIARCLLNHASCVLARDHDSLRVAERLLGRRAAPGVVRFCPDLAFCLTPTLPNPVCITPALGSEEKAPLVGLNVSGLLYNGGYSGDNMFGLECDYKRVISDIVEAFLASTEAHLLLIPHVFSDDVESDNLACIEVLTAVPGPYRSRVHLVSKRYDQNELKGIIGLCDFFIGSRMHACIAALSQKIPTVGLAYSKKFLGVFESVGMKDCVVDARDATSNGIVDVCLGLFERRAALVPVLEKRIPDIESNLVARIQELAGHSHHTDHRWVGQREG
jgi:polysaccharide pyruvyl transferase WcaK-like protein